jgi:hypothetical protein
MTSIGAGLGLSAIQQRDSAQEDAKDGGSSSTEQAEERSDCGAHHAAGEPSSHHHHGTPSAEAVDRPAHDDDKRLDGVGSMGDGGVSLHHAAKHSTGA